MKGLLNKRNGIIAGIVAVIIVAAIVVSTSFSSATNLEKAKEIAQEYVPSSAKFITSEEEERYFEVAFYDEANKENFEVEVNKETGEVKKVESQLSDDRGSKEITLTEEEAKKAVENRFAGISGVTAVLTKDNGLFEYEVSFKGDGFYGDADVNAETGAVLDSVVKYGTVVTIPSDAAEETEMLTYDQAREAAIKEAGGGTVRDMDLDKEAGEYYYEVELHIDNMERDYIINAQTGEITLVSEHPCTFDHNDGDDLYVEKEPYVPEEQTQQQEASSFEPETSVSSESAQDTSSQSQGIISEKEAKEIVRTKIPGAEFVEFYLEREDGIEEYEGTAHLDGYEYEFEINAASGIVTGWDKERIEYDDYDDDWDDDDWDDDEWDD